MTDAALRRGVNAALRAKIMTRGHISELLLRCPTHPGTKRLKPFAEQTLQAPTRSGFEDDFLAFCARYDIPEPRVNTRVGPYEVDAYFAAQNLIVELDGWDFHNDRETWARDRERDAEAYTDGIGTVRITWERCTTRRSERPRGYAISSSSRLPRRCMSSTSARRRRARGRSRSGSSMGCTSVTGR